MSVPVTHKREPRQTNSDLFQAVLDDEIRRTWRAMHAARRNFRFGARTTVWDYDSLLGDHVRPNMQIVFEDRLRALLRVRRLAREAGRVTVYQTKDWDHQDLEDAGYVFRQRRETAILVHELEAGSSRYDVYLRGELYRSCPSLAEAKRAIREANR